MFKSDLADQLEAGRRGSAVSPGAGDAAANAEFGRKSPVQVMQQVWPDNNPADMPSTQYPDLQTNPSFDMRHLIAEAERVARKHWWKKENKDQSADDYGTTPDGPDMTWPEEVAGWQDRRKA